MSNINREQLGEWLSAYLDGELNDQQTKQVEGLLLDDASARQQLERLRLASTMVSALPRRHAPDSIAEDIQHFIERDSLLDEMDTEPATSSTWRSPLTRVFSMVAMLGIIVTGAWFVTRDGTLSSSPSAERFAESTNTFSDVEADLGAGETAEKTVSTPQPVEFGYLLASASFEQKLKAGLGLEAAKDHRFENEAVRLRVVVSDKLEQSRVTAKLTSLLLAQQSVLLTEASIDHDSKIEKPGQYFFEGQLGVNYSAKNEKQLLVRATPQQIEELVDELNSIAPNFNDVVLASGPTIIRGQSQIIAALNIQPVITDDLTDDQTDHLGEWDDSFRRDERIAANEPVALGPFEGLIDLFNFNSENLNPLKSNQVMALNISREDFSEQDATPVFSRADLNVTVSNKPAKTTTDKPLVLADATTTKSTARKSSAPKSAKLRYTLKSKSFAQRSNTKDATDEIAQYNYGVELKEEGPPAPTAQPKTSPTRTPLVDRRWHLVISQQERKTSRRTGSKMDQEIRKSSIGKRVRGKIKSNSLRELESKTGTRATRPTSRRRVASDHEYITLVVQVQVKPSHKAATRKSTPIYKARKTTRTKKKEREKSPSS